MASNFDFEIQREQSAVKTAIVTKYFSAWTKVMKNQCEKVAYIDLYSGPGVYEDGTESTPLIILRKIINDNVLCNKVVTIFNEKNKSYYEELYRNITALNGIDNLKYRPIIKNFEVDKSTADLFKSRLVPCFSFIDPAGYSGLTLDLIKALGKDYGSDLIFFFNYNDINRAISNKKVEKHMEELFGLQRYKKLVESLEYVTAAHDRELVILNTMAEAIKETGIKYVLPFRFKFEGKDRTSHYLIFTSKKFLGYNIMKDIMYSSGEKDHEGVGKFEFISTSDKQMIQLSMIDLFSSSLNELKNDLLNKYSGRTITFELLYREHSINNKFIKKHYKEVLIELEKQGKIYCMPANRRANTMADHVRIKFE